MKKYFQILFLFIAILLNAGSAFGQTVATYNYTGGAQTWTVPAAVSTATVYCWGGGGGGAGSSCCFFNWYANGGGGGGGACSKNVISVSAGQVYNITVGAAGTGGTSGGTGGTTTISGTAGTFWAAGGNGGTVSGGLGTNAGGSGGNTGTGTIYSGGNGSAGFDGTNSNNGIAGTGGGGAGSAGNGTSPTMSCAGTGPGGTGTYTGGTGGYSNASCGSPVDVAGVPGATPGGGGGAYYNWDIACSVVGAIGGYGQVVILYSAVVAKQSQWISMNIGSTSWCENEVRTVAVTVKNNGTSTWTDASPDINIGCKWDAELDYFVRVNAGGLAAGATQTYSFTMTAPAAGTNHLTFDVVSEGDCWFGWNNGTCGPGNATYASSLLTIACCTPGIPTAITGTPTGQTTATLSWTPAASVASPTVTYYWYVGTNSGGNCPTSLTYNYTGGLQSWTVPAGVTSVVIDSRGAAGGSDGASNVGGLGARMSGTFTVVPGHVIQILVGGVGGNGLTYQSGSGGGGTFVYDATSATLLIAAGGGGGASLFGYGTSATSDGVVSTTGNTGSSTSGGAGGTGGAGGAAGPYSGGGAGWSSNGTGIYGQGGFTFLNGGAGGANYAGYGPNGGYGGGGGVYAGAGGGGGYSGGGSGGWIYGWGGGGGSYNAGTSQSNSAGVQTGNGLVTIAYSSAAIAQGSTTSTSASVTGLTCATTYYLSVYAQTNCNGTRSSCGTSGAFTTSACCVSAPATPGAISGTATQCQSLAGQTYSIAAVSNATTYTWAVPTGWAITAGQGTINLTVTTGTAGQNGNITVTAGNGCGTSAAASLAVTSTAPGNPFGGPDQYICTATTTATMAATNIGTWTMISGPNTPNIVSTTSTTSQVGTVTPLITGTYVFRWTSGCSLTVPYDDVVIVKQ